ncbi:hypothetical protein FHS56_000557 [Thermonema lapsum]|uniref:Uncharacterized protein n=1 Tax=Thermonema lapsum TaxID=28195 RepID=A0A846MNP0_9BACT|nr:hypothetical protein [Thermonema lapsum]NIK73071.1 hypothetical protein [Thermonema lapsum]
MEELKQKVKALEKVVEKNKHLSLSDAAAQSGLPLDEVREAMQLLIERYHCRLRVTQGGDLIYDFGDSLRRRDQKTWEERWDEIKAALWKGFQVFFKAWIAVTLVVYFVIFVVLLITALLALSSGNRDDRNRGPDLSGVFYMIARIFQEIWIWNTLTNASVYRRDPYGFPYKTYEPRTATIGKTKKKSFIASVYDFVFGPPRPQEDPLNNHKELAAFARQNKGIVVMPEVKALAGWNEDQANDFLTECLVRYDGQARISENGVLYGDFEELTRSVSKEGDHPVVWYWNEYEAPYVLTGNSRWRNVGIAAMNLFNLLFGALFVIGSEPDPMASGFWAHTDIFLGWVPFLFSVIFFTVPILRSFWVRRKEKERLRNNVRKLVMKNLFTHISSGNDTLPETQLLHDPQNSIKAPRAVARKVMKELIVDWHGEAIAQSNGSVVYRFEQPAFELKEAKRLRAQRNDDFDSENTYIELKS